MPRPLRFSAASTLKLFRFYLPFLRRWKERSSGQWSRGLPDDSQHSQLCPLPAGGVEQIALPPSNLFPFPWPLGTLSETRSARVKEEQAQGPSPGLWAGDAENQSGVRWKRNHSSLRITFPESWPALPSSRASHHTVVVPTFS